VVLARRGRLRGRMLRRAWPGGARRRSRGRGPGRGRRALALAQRQRVRAAGGVSRTGRRRSWRPYRRAGACGRRLPCGFASAVRPPRRRPRRSAAPACGRSGPAS
jgi:hypothetical protein